MQHVKKISFGAITITVAIILLLTLLPIVNEEGGGETNENILNVFILSGQSNAQYFQEDIAITNQLNGLPQNTAFYYGTASQPAEYSDTWVSDYPHYSIFSMTDSNGNYTIGSLEPGFAQTFCEKTRQKVLIINVARGGASIADFMPGSYLDIYSNTIITDAMSKIPTDFTVVKCSLIWIQGEADRSMSPDEYVADLATVISKYQRDGYKTVLLSKVRTQWSPEIATIQSEFADSKSFIKITSLPDTFSISAGTMASDNLHYSQLGRNQLGEELGSMTFTTSVPSNHRTLHRASFL